MKSYFSPPFTCKSLTDQFKEIHKNIGDPAAPGYDADGYMMARLQFVRLYTIAEFKARWFKVPAPKKRRVVVKRKTEVYIFDLGKGIDKALKKIIDEFGK